jgi:hypothetical protein
VSYYEFVADDYYTYFKDANRWGIWLKFPLNAIAPDKKKDGKIPDRPYGYPTTPLRLPSRMTP